MKPLAQSERDQWYAALRQQTEESEKNWATAFVLSVCLGLLGADRLYLGHPLLGTLKLCTLGMGGVWWLFDIALLLCGAMKDAHGKRLRRPF